MCVFDCKHTCSNVGFLRIEGQRDVYVIPGSPLVQEIADPSEVPRLDFHITHYWRHFRFCPKLDDFWDQVGWEATCLNPDHERCVKTMNFRKHGGRLAVERKLKYWCLAGEDLGTKGQHLKVPFPENMPSLSRLDGLESVRDMLVQSGADGVTAALVKRPRR